MSNKFGIEEIKDTIDSIQKLGLINEADKGIIISIPDEIIEYFNEYSYTTIHMVIETLLYYITHTNLVIEFDYYLYRFSEDVISDVTNVKLINIIINNDIVKKLIDFINDNTPKDESGYMFAGWLIGMDNINFYTSFDFILLNNKRIAL